MVRLVMEECYVDTQTVLWYFDEDPDYEEIVALFFLEAGYSVLNQ